MDARAALSAVEGVDETAVAVGIPAKDTPSQTSFPARRVSGGRTKQSHARSRAAAAAVLQVLFGVALGAVVVIATRHHPRASAARGSAETSASTARSFGASAPVAAAIPAGRRDDDDDASSSAEAELNHARVTVARLWDVVDALQAETAAVKAWARRETCDLETLAPFCASARDDDRSFSIPRGARTRTSDLRLRRLWGSPVDDPSPVSPTELLTITVGAKMMSNVDAIVNAFNAEKTQVVLFHYDGVVDAWNDAYEWSRRAVHVSAPKQSKWWFAKRFLHPDIVHPYERVWVWDEDIDVTGAGVLHDAFDPEAYVAVAERHGLEISQPALIAGKGAWPITRRISVSPGTVNVSSEIPEMHRFGKDWRGEACLDDGGVARLRPPCAAYVEIMVPVFSRRAWRCVWNMIQNDLTHGWGLDLTWHTCAADPAHNKTAVQAMGVVDAQGVKHLGVPTLSEQGEGSNAAKAFQAVRRRRAAEWDLFNARWRAPDVEALFQIEREQRPTAREALARLAEVAAGRTFERFEALVERFDDDESSDE